MDLRTIAAYDADSAAYAEEWENEQEAPTDLYALLKKHWRPGATVDIGCGSGRDTAWLSSNGFPAIGYDASTGLLAEARKRHPGVRFESGSLPQLAGIADASFTNVLCETVIMHLPDEEVVPSVMRMVQLLKPGGSIYLSWRVTPLTDRRDDSGRLYAAFDESPVVSALAGLTLRVDDQVVSASSGRVVRRIIAVTAASA